MNKQILKRFDLFKKSEGVKLDLEKVEFELVELRDAGNFKFVKGLNKYIRTTVAANPGDVPVVGASLDNDGIYSYVTPIAASDLINEPSVTFNKDNAKGSRAFFRDYPFVMDRHHIGIIPNTEKIFPKFFYYFLNTHLISRNFGWGENVATVELIQEARLPIPKPSQGLSSVEIQQVLVDFIRFDNNRWGNKLEKADQLIAALEKLENAIVPRTLAKSPAAMRKLQYYLDRKRIDFDVEKLEFEEIKLSSQVNFTGGKSKYTKGYITKNEGIYPLLTGKLEDDSVGAYISEFDLEGPAITFNKDNAAGSRSVLRKRGEKFAMNSHHLAVFTKNQVSDEVYNYYNLVINRILKEEKFGWEKVASPSNVGSKFIKIPKAVIGLEQQKIQILISSFCELYISEVQRKKSCIEKSKAAIPRYNDALVKTLFASLKNIAHAH